MTLIILALSSLILYIGSSYFNPICGLMNKYCPDNLKNILYIGVGLVLCVLGMTDLRVGGWLRGLRKVSYWLYRKIREGFNKKYGYIHIWVWPTHQPPKYGKNKKDMLFFGLFSSIGTSFAATHHCHQPLMYPTAATHHGGWLQWWMLVGVAPVVVCCGGW